MGMSEQRYNPEAFAHDMFEAVLLYARENDKAFRDNIAKDYHATLFVAFFMIYGIDLVNYFLLNKHGQFNKDVSNKLFLLMTDRIEQSFSETEAEMVKDCVSVMEDEIIKALGLPFEEGANNPFFKLARYIPSIIDIRDEYNKLHADQLLFNCLGETFVGIGKLVEQHDWLS